MTIARPVNFARWIEDNRHLLKPPVGNKTMVVGQDFLVQVVGGPNARTDFHVDPYEEWFYQLAGDMHVNVVAGGELQRVDIREGETWLLPGSVPHSPQRPQPGSVGLVIERIRAEGTLEKFQWYCQRCTSLLYEVELQVRDIVTDLPPAFETFYADSAAHACGRCGAIHPGKG